MVLVTVWQASAQAPGDEDSRCGNQRGPYPLKTKMLMDSRNYEHLITGSSIVWQALDVDGTGRGVSMRCVILFTRRNCLFIIYIYIFFLPISSDAVEKFVWWSLCCSAKIM